MEIPHSEDFSYKSKIKKIWFQAITSCFLIPTFFASFVRKPYANYISLCRLIDIRSNKVSQQ